MYVGVGGGGGGGDGGGPVVVFVLVGWRWENMCINVVRAQAIYVLCGSLADFETRWASPLFA